jgi:hypothetical protein
MLWLVAVSIKLVPVEGYISSITGVEKRGRERMKIDREGLRRKAGLVDPLPGTLYSGRPRIPQLYSRFGDSSRPHYSAQCPHLKVSYVFCTLQTDRK